MKNSGDRKDQTEKEPRCDPKQLELLKKCSKKRDMTEWNNWRQENPEKKIWLEGADLNHAHLEGAHLECAHLKNANFTLAYLKSSFFNEALLEGAKFGSAHLEDTIFYHADLRNADVGATIVNGATSFWKCEVDRKTNFRGVGLDICRIDEGTKYLLQYNIRRMNCEDWYKEHPQLASPVKAFFWISDYGNSTRRIIGTFFILAICFAIVYYIWGAIDYYLLGITESPGIVANLFIDQNRPVLCWLVPLRSIYFSIVTMTTLGFGDMYANCQSFWGHLLLTVQVILGYVLLGALVTRFGVLFTSGLISGEFKSREDKRQKTEDRKSDF